jgi:hypothetical protein
MMRLLASCAEFTPLNAVIMSATVLLYLVIQVPTCMILLIPMIASALQFVGLLLCTAQVLSLVCRLCLQC